MPVEFFIRHRFVPYPFLVLQELLRPIPDFLIPIHGGARRVHANWIVDQLFLTRNSCRPKVYNSMEENQPDRYFLRNPLFGSMVGNVSDASLVPTRF